MNGPWTARLLSHRTTNHAKETNQSCIPASQGHVTILLREKQDDGHGTCKDKSDSKWTIAGNLINSGKYTWDIPKNRDLGNGIYGIEIEIENDGYTMLSEGPAFVVKGNHPELSPTPSTNTSVTPIAWASAMSSAMASTTRSMGIVGQALSRASLVLGIGFALFPIHGSLDCEKIVPEEARCT